MDCIILKKTWKNEEEISFKGWNFSYLDGRWEEEELPWSYEELLKNILKPEFNLLDMGTGGGEFLLSLHHPYKNTSITEMWEPNVKLCRETLSPLGIEVKHIYEDSPLPFEDNTFDFIINRHDSYDVKEVKRILKPDGLFLTQQVGGQNNELLSKQLIKDFVPEYPDNHLAYCSKELEENNFEIILNNEYFPYLHFFDVGAVVHFAKVIPWEFPNFTVDSCFSELCDLQKSLDVKPYIESFEHRFILLAKNLK